MQLSKWGVFIKNKVLNDFVNFITGILKKIIIGFVSTTDPFQDRVSWSGTNYKLRESIERAGFDVQWIPYGHSLKSSILELFIRVWNRVFRRNGRWLGRFHFRPLDKVWAKDIDANPKVRECDYLFFPLGSQIALYTKIKKPFINLSGYTVPLMMDYYYFDILERSKGMAIDMDRAASKEAFINIRSSDWANDSLINDYHCDKNRCFVLEMCANIDTKDIKENSPYNGGQLRILFSGVDWNRKGGDIAVEVVKIMRDKGIDAHLIVVGPRKCPESCMGKPYVNFIGYCDKNNPSDYQKYIDLYEQSHISLLPTKAECGAIVYSEAAAAGMPCYTYLTGGTGNYVINGVNGYALPEGSSALDFAEQIINDINEGRLPKLREGAKKMFVERLSWEVWSNRFHDIMYTFVKS